ncbi:hypothetical protein MUGA111182_19920 [Mucilaginibacter galii]|uniref:DUF3828 domain-containing protein n=1 Tax=Mucilaginibacter galii TaxID=2005073 RepID=A0A917JB45_9SPHI|nr:hypothetical protein [Mucilaginibacter galii]GGI52388.1 hypothetical protein GCM10011425_36000 [Mucilaginibacter galii]
MKKMIYLFIAVNFLSIKSYSQKKMLIETNNQIKNTVVNFLNWYRLHKDNLERSAIVSGFNQDTVKKDSVLKVNMPAVEQYLINFKKSNYVSESFLNNLRSVYKGVSDNLIKHPITDYFGPVPGLESDLVFGFEPEEILGHIKTGKFTKIYTVYDKAIVKFDISRYNQCIFTMTKVEGKWLIDYFGYDGTNRDKYLKYPPRWRTRAACAL